MPNPNVLKVVDSLQGSNFLAITSVLPFFDRHGVKLPQYKIWVVADRGSSLILFGSAEPKNPGSKCIGVRPDADLEISAADACSFIERIAQLQVVDTLQGTSVQPIRTAMAVFRDRLAADITQYRITLSSEADSETVSFVDKTAQPGVRGAGGTRPGFEVTMNAADFRILKSYFLR